MMKTLRTIASILILLAAVETWAVEYPTPSGWVNDYAGVLSSAQRLDLDTLLADFEDATSYQIFVALMERVPEDSTLEAYVNELFTRWNPGQEGQDNGVLLAVFVNDRTLRIEVGYGLEPTLTDAASKLIIANDITPGFKEDDYYRGLRQGLTSIMQTLQPDYVVPPPALNQPTAPSQQEPALDFEIRDYFPALVVALIIFSFVINMIRRANRTGWSSSRRGWRRTRRNDAWIGWLILHLLLRMFLRGGGHGDGGSGGGSFHDFTGGGGGMSGGGGASGSW